ncbi:MAG: hypothetical protein DRP22_01145 [Verrucomicrobia bacterium]|nr:MAG: hypothetical protein DRP22_01145 [Verrucomicrobiota bacterium]
MTEVRPEDVSRKIRDLYERGVAAYERENLDYAIEVLNTCLEFEPRLLAARKYLRAAEIRKHRHNAKNRVFHLVQTLAGLPQFLLGNLKLSRQPREALKTAESLMRRDPFNLLFIRLLGRAAEAADLPEAALQTLEVAREYYPHDGQLLDWMGRLYMQTGQARKARECYERLVQLRPTDPAALKKLKDATALDTMQKGGWDQATSYRDVIRDEKEAVRLEKESKAVKTERDIQDLIAALREDLKRTPDDVNRHRRLAELLVQAERYEEALEVLGRCQQLAGGRDPEIDQMFTNVKLKIFDRDIRRLREAGDAAAAEAKEKEKQEFVLRAAREKVERYPHDLQYRYELGVLLYERGLLTEAIQQFQQAQRHPQRRLKSLYYLALCFKAKKQYDIAMEQLEKAAAEIPSMDALKKDILYEMGTIAEAMGDREKAARCFKEIYAVDISYKDVAEKVEKIYGQ